MTTSQIEATPKPPLWTGSFWAACSANFLMFFAFYMLLPVLPMYLSEAFGADPSTAGLVLASYTLMALLFRPFAGAMVDSFPRKPLLMVCFTIFIAYFGGYMLAGTLLVFAILRATHGLAFGMVTVSINTLAIDIMPSSRRGEGIGYFGVSTNLAMAVGPMIALMLYDTTANYNLIFAAACVSGLLGLTMASLIKPTDRVVTPAPQTISLDRFLLVKGIPGAINTVFLSFGYGVLSTYVAVYGAQEVGIKGGAGMFFVCMSCGLIISRLISGRLINKGYLTAIAKSGISVLIVSFFCFAMLKNPVTFYSCGVSIGLGYGLLCPALQNMFIDLASHDKRGTANATYLTSWDLGIGIGVLLGGAIAQGGSYSLAFTIGAVLLAIGLVLYLFWTAPYYRRNRLR